MEYLITILVIFMAVIIGLAVGNWLRLKTGKFSDRTKKKR
jgi:uncharacterized protein YneF (UPF0154 family)